MLTATTKLSADGLSNVHLAFDSPEQGALTVDICSKGIELTRGGQTVLVTQREARQIQELLANACSHVWRGRGPDAQCASEARSRSAY